MYKVITISKRTGEEDGYLGEYDTQQEAEQIANKFNLKADRHPSIAKVINSEEESFFTENYKNPTSTILQSVSFDEEENDSEDEFVFEDSEDDSEDEFVLEDSEDDSDSEEQDFYNSQIIPRSIPQQPTYQNPIEKPVYEKPKTFTGLISDQSTDRMKSNNKHEMKYNKDRFMFRDVGSTSSVSSMRKHSTRPFMFQGQIKHSIQGIIINGNKVLIREPANHKDGVTWEFYGGTSLDHETEEQTVIRETKEETGYSSRILGYIDDFTFKNVVLKFFLLEKTSKQEVWKDFQTREEETWSTKWVTKEQAWNYFKLNRDTLYKRILRNALDEAFHKYKLINMR